MLVTRIVRRSCFPFAHFLSILALSSLIIHDSNSIDHHYILRWKRLSYQPWYEVISVMIHLQKLGPWRACSDTHIVCGNHNIHYNFYGYGPFSSLHETHLRPWNLVNYKMLHSALFWSHIFIYSSFLWYIGYMLVISCCTIGWWWWCDIYCRAYNSMISIQCTTWKIVCLMRFRRTFSGWHRWVRV